MGYGEINKRGWTEYTPTAHRNSGKWAISARGWLWDGEHESSLGNYLDYEADHYRSGHEYCPPNGCNCRESQPGNIHCLVYKSATTGGQRSRYVETIEQARAWIEVESGYKPNTVICAKCWAQFPTDGGDFTLAAAHVDTCGEVRNA